jgi:hypothetical protein
MIPLPPCAVEVSFYPTAPELYLEARVGIERNFSGLIRLPWRSPLPSYPQSYPLPARR